jgi:hypothetical protein
MSEERYNVVFTGEIIGSMDPAVAKQNFSDTFKVTGMRLDALFSGKPVVLKKNIDYRNGMKFRGQLKRIGMISSFNPLEQAEQAPTPSGGAVDPVATTNTAVTDTSVATSSAAPNDDWSLAPVGSDMNQIKDTRPAVSVDVSQISVAPVGVDILVEKKPVIVLDVDTSKLSVS